VKVVVLNFGLGAGVGLTVGFLLSYVLYLSLLQKDREYVRETARIMRNVEDYLGKHK